MPNNIPIESVISATLGLIESNSVLSKLVHRDAEKGFTGGVGDTVRVRVPKVIEARDGTGEATVFTDIDEGAVPVTLSAEAYSAVRLTDKEMSLELVNFGVSVLQPQSSGVAKFSEKAIAGVMNDQVNDVENTNVVDPAAPLGAIAKAAAEFTRRELDMPGRSLVIGPDILESILNLPALQNAAAAGNTDIIEGGYLTRIMGFDIYVSPFISGVVAFTREAFALANRAPLPSEGAGYASTQAHNGYSIRYVRDFDMSVRGDVSLMSTFVGAAVLDPRRFMAFKIDGV